MQIVNQSAPTSFERQSNVAENLIIQWLSVWIWLA